MIASADSIMNYNTCIYMILDVIYEILFKNVVLYLRLISLLLFFRYVSATLFTTHSNHQNAW